MRPRLLCLLPVLLLALALLAWLLWPGCPRPVPVHGWPGPVSHETPLIEVEPNTCRVNVR
jgi:hypothetical protein